MDRQTTTPAGPPARRRPLARLLGPAVAAAIAASAPGAAQPPGPTQPGTPLVTASAPAPPASASGSILRTISQQSEKLEITTNSSRILTLGRRIPRVQVNNPELLTVTPLSATQVQVSAKKAGVTVINLWDEDGVIHSVDVFIYGDVRELQHALRTQFPNSSVKVYRYSSALVLTGFIDRPDFVEPMVQLAQDYSPKVINNIQVGGVQQVLLKVKVFEVSRTKARALGTDFSWLGAGGGFFSSGVSGLLTNTTNGAPGAIQTIVDSGGQTVEFGIVNGGNQLFGLLDALQRHDLAKILAEPNIVAVSGRPAQFNEGGEIPILIPQGLGQVSIEYKPFGTQVDFLPIVLGNGNIRLEVRPRISDLDPANGVSLNNVTIPALTVRQVDTAVEMKAGQTFALAGLIQRRTQAVNSGVPYLSDLPVLGAPFRRVSEEVNEIELLILVTPEFVDAIEPHETPRCLPGSGTISPSNGELYWGGHLEVPNRCGPCGACGCIPTHGHTPCCPAARLGVDHTPGGYPGAGYEGGIGMGCGCQEGAPFGAVGVPLPLPATAAPPGGVEDGEAAAEGAADAMAADPAQPRTPPGGATDAYPPVESYPAMPLRGDPAEGTRPGTPRPGATSQPAAETRPAAAPDALQRGELVMPPAPTGYRPPPGRGAATPAPRPAAAGAGPAAEGSGPVFGRYPGAHQPRYRRQPSGPYVARRLPPPRQDVREAARPSASTSTVDPQTGLIGPMGYEAE